MDLELFGSGSNLLVLWLAALIFAVASAVFASLVPSRLEGLRKSILGLMILPGLVFALTYALRGFGVLERPLVHWVFAKEAAEALRLGFVFDPISFAVVVFPGVAMIAIAFRNRPTIRMSAAFALSWVGMGVVGTAQTLWMAVLGIGVQLLSRILPLIEGGGFPEAEDALWIASTKRAWIGLGSALCGGAGLAASGVRLDFFSEIAWTSLETSAVASVAGILLVFGLLVMAAPVFASNALHSRTDGAVEENLFVSEASLAWISATVFFRLFGSLHEASWLLMIGIAAIVATSAAIVALTFQPTKNGAIHLWLSSYPAALLMILPFLPAREAQLFFMGGMIAFCGLWIAFDHPRSKADITAATVFLLGAFGFFGWATSAGVTNFFSKFETDPFLRMPVFAVLLGYSAFGWRLAIRGGDRGTSSAAHAKWIVLGFLFIFGFGPLLSGRWSGGALPGEPDWIDGAKAWAWVKSGAEGDAPSDWLGFGMTQGLGVLSALLGVFAWRTAELFPFAAKYPRVARAAKGIFGLVWLQEAGAELIRRAGRFWTETVSSRLWERGIPFVVSGIFAGFRKAGEAAEKIVDPITSDGYGKALAPAAKLVQWFHGGNVRLYAWFALVWILIFSVYLTR